MIRLILFLSALTLHVNGIAQGFLLKDSFPGVKGYRIVTMRQDQPCIPNSPKNIVSARHYFDNAGNIIRYESVMEGKVAGRTEYHYAGGLLVSQKDYHTWRVDNADPKKTSWDSTYLSNELSFTYNSGKLTGISNYNTLSERVSFEQSFNYDGAGKIISESIKIYYDSLTNSGEWVKYSNDNQKKYSYNDTITEIKYYRNGVHKATEKIRKNKVGKVLSESLKDIAGKVLREKKIRYNARMQAVEVTGKDSGYDGFGNPHDIFDPEKLLLSYDASGRLVMKEMWFRGRRCGVDRYEYVK